MTQHIFIFDLEGFSLTMATHTPTLDILQRLISIYEGSSKYLVWEFCHNNTMVMMLVIYEFAPLANYPETLKAAYVLNAPKVFQIVFRIVKVAKNIKC